jgi:hypothetical protein
VTETGRSKACFPTAEKDRVRNQITSNNNVRSIWKVIRKCVPSKIKLNACYSKNLFELCEEFNDHFVFVGE